MRTDGRMKILGDEKACHKKSLSRTKMDKRVAIMRQGDNTRNTQYVATRAGKMIETRAFSFF